MMPRHHGHAPRMLGAALTVTLTLWAGYLLARNDGMTGVAQSATGCSCHSSTPNANGAVTVTITGPQAVQPASTSTYTITVSGGPAGTTGGFNLKATAGTLIAGLNSKIVGGELTHSNSSSRSWSFNWTAPATQGTVNLYAASQATNGSGSNGDSWNWYGGAVNTPFPITVSSTVGVEDDNAPAFSLGPAYPNPFLGAARFDFSLAEAGSARMEVFDLSGRRVATIVSGNLTAGRHAARWDGRDEGGRVVGAGVYLVRLTTGGRTLSARVIRAS